MNAFAGTDTMPRQKRNDEPVKLDKEVVRVARIVAAYRGISMAEYLSTKLLDQVKDDLARHQQADGATPSESRKRNR